MEGTVKWIMQTKYIFLILTALTVLMIYAAQLLIAHPQREPTGAKAPMPPISLNMTTNIKASQAFGL